MERKTQELSYRLHKYNSVRVLQELKKIVLENGGKYQEFNFDNVVISNRTLSENKCNLKKELEELKKASQEQPDNKLIKNAIRSTKEKMENLEKIEAPEILVKGGCALSIHFILNDMFYSYSIDDNPFFDFHYQKKPVLNNEKVSWNYYASNLKEWLYNAKADTLDYLSDNDIKELADALFNELVNAPVSEHFREGKKQRVNNYYNNGYHYEMIYKPERYESIVIEKYSNNTPIKWIEA